MVILLTSIKIIGGLFRMGKNVYTSDIKWAVVRDKPDGKLTMREIMEK